MIIPFFSASRRSPAFSLLLLLAFILLLFTGLGVFRLYFDFDWMGNASDGQLFSLKIRGGNSYNLFMSKPLGPAFWTTQAMTLVMAVIIPFFRPIGAAILALLTAVGIFAVNYFHGAAVPAVPVEFELLTVFVLFSLYVLCSWIGEIRDRSKFASLMSQYVPPELANQYSRDPDSMGLEGEERVLSVLFCDVIGFSSVTEKLDPPTLARWLNGYFSLASKIIVRHSGTIDKYIGDSVMAFWGAPARSETHAYDALSAAYEIQQELATLNTEYERIGWPTVAVGIGVSTGPANVGNLGSEYRMAYTVVGDTVNVAQRIEAQTRLYKVPIVVSGNTAEILPDTLFRELDTVSIKGRKRPVKMFEPLGSRAEASDELIRKVELHKQAMAAGKQGQWQSANKLFSKLKDEWGPESMYELYLRGIKQASAAGKSGAGSGGQASGQASAKAGAQS